MANGCNGKESEGVMRRGCNKYRPLNSEDGMVLVVGLLLLLVATVAGITALSTSTTNVMVAGNRRLSELNFSAADSGVSVSVPVIDDTVFYGYVNSKYLSTEPPLVRDSSTFASVNEDTSDNATTNPDLQFSMGDGPSASTVSVDVDYLYGTLAEGCAREFAMGYLGVGRGGAGGGCTRIYYAINSISQAGVGSEAEVCGVYRYVK